jgi:molybdopterin molybdotransferase
MAQLSDDCFAHGQRLTPLDEALDLLRARLVAVTPVEAAPLIECAGRILAEDVVSERAVPPHDNSAVDGYAVFFDDLDPDGETVLPVAGRLAAGEAPEGRATRGEAIRIFTGAPMPEGADTVMMQEDCVEQDGRVRIPAGIKRGANRRFAGEDIAAGDTVQTKGQVLRPQDVGLAASIGLTALPVHAPLRVALFSTGDELREPGEATPPGTVYDANRYALGALLRGLGCRVTDLGILRDDRAAITTALGAAAADHDLVLTSGGVSVGEEDHVRAAVESQGHIHFWRLAIKPGRPVALGQIGATPFLGLPGNPVAVMVTFLRFARPLILRLMGAADPAPVLFRVRADFDHKKKADRREWVRARLSMGADGVPVATKFPRQGAGILSSMVAADGLVELPEALTYLEKGTMVEFLPFSEVGA